MKLNELEVKLIDDFSHQVTRKIDKYGDRPDFPNMDVYRIDRQELDGYLFDKQAILDMEGSPRSLGRDTNLGSFSHSRGKLALGQFDSIGSHRLWPFARAFHQGLGAYDYQL